MKGGQTYFLCPACWTLFLSFQEIWNERQAWSCQIEEGDDTCFYMPGTETLGRRLVGAYCTKCNHITKDYFAEDLMVFLEENHLEPIGGYWKDHEEDLPPTDRVKPFDTNFFQEENQ